jgi:hypothetical protein
MIIYVKRYLVPMQDTDNFSRIASAPLNTKIWLNEVLW